MKKYWKEMKYLYYGGLVGLPFVFFFDGLIASLIDVVLFVLIVTVIYFKVYK